MDSRTCYVPPERKRDIPERDQGCYDGHKCAYFLPNRPRVVSKIRTRNHLELGICVAGNASVVALVDRDVPARKLPPETGTQKNCSVPGPSWVRPRSVPGPSRVFKAGTNP